MRDVIGLAALAVLAFVGWSTDSLAVFAVGGALTVLFCWRVDEARS